MSQTTVAGSFITVNTIDSDHYIDGSIDLAHIGANQIDGTKLALASQAAGDVMYYNGTDWIRLAKGTADQILTMNDGATAPGWETAAAGGDLSFGGDTFTEDKVIGSNDAFALSFETAGTVRMRIEGAEGGAGYTAAGAITMPTQPAFSAHPSGEITNVTGATGGSSDYTTVHATELFDQGNDFSSTTFTAPVDGRYRFTATSVLTGMTSSHTGGSTRITTTDRSYIVYMNPYNNTETASAAMTMITTALTDMDAGDTAIARVHIQGGGGSNVVDFQAGSQFSGELVV